MLRGGGIAGKQQRAEDKGQKAPDHRVKLQCDNNVNGIGIKAPLLLDESAETNIPALRAAMRDAAIMA